MRGLVGFVLAILAAACLVVLAPACTGDDGSEPTIRLSYIVGEVGMGQDRVIYVQDGNGGPRKIGEPGRYGSLALSPDGSTVVIARIVDDRGVLDLIDVESGERTNRTEYGDPFWSPDSERIALGDYGGARLIDADVSVIGQTSYSTEGGESGAGFLWNDESTRFAGVRNGQLIAGTRDGEFTLVEPPEGEFFSAVMRWDGETEVLTRLAEFVDPDNPDTDDDDSIPYVRVDLADAPATLSFESWTDDEFAGLFIDEEQQHAAEALLGVDEVRFPAPTVDGAGTVYSATGTSLSGLPEIAAIAVAYGDELVRIDLPERIFGLRPAGAIGSVSVTLIGN